MTREAIAIVQPLEGPEQPVDLGHVEPFAVVAHVADPVLTAEADRALSLVRTVLPGVADQVLQHAFQKLPVTGDHHAFLNAHLDRARHVGHSQVAHDPAGQRAQIDGLQSGLHEPHLREIEHPVQGGLHLLAPADDAADVILASLIQQVRILLQHQLGVAIHHPKRRPEIVGHRVVQKFQLLLALAKLGRPLLDPPLQLLRPLPELLRQPALVFQAQRIADRYADHLRDPLNQVEIALQQLPFPCDVVNREYPQRFPFAYDRHADEGVHPQAGKEGVVLRYGQFLHVGETVHQQGLPGMETAQQQSALAGPLQQVFQLLQSPFSLVAGTEAPLQHQAAVVAVGQKQHAAAVMQPLLQDLVHAEDDVVHLDLPGDHLANLVDHQGVIVVSLHLC